MKLRHALFGIDSKYKNNRKYAGEESDIDDEWIEGHEEQLKAKDIEKAEKKYAKDNEKLVEDGKEPRDESVLKEKIDAIEEEYKKLEEERGTGKATLRRERLPERLEEQIAKLDEKIKTFKLQMQDRDAGKEVALGTR
jgi:DNA topoisomerase I